MAKSTAVTASDLFYNLTHANANLDPLWTNGKCGRVTFAQIIFASTKWIPCDTTKSFALF